MADDDPACAWPFWKFGLKKDDLFTTLHDRYNTFASSIQDPEAFHHDVWECSHEARSTDEFHELLASRREQRLRELNDSLESASLEIIANPSLIGTEQWPLALQLFRSKSLDSLVRYFYSYLPDNHPYRDDSSASSVSGGSVDDSISHSLVAYSPIFFDHGDEKSMMTHEPCHMSTIAQSHLPPSPRSMTMCSEESADVVHHTYMLNNLTPARTASISESESERYTLPSASQDSRHFHDYDTSQMPDPETPISQFSDEFPDIGTGSFEMLEKERDVIDLTPNEKKKVGGGELSEPTVIDLTTAEMEPETPKPKPEARAGSIFDTKVVLPRRQGRSLSPSRPHPLSQVHTHQPNHDDNDHCQKTVAATSAKLRRRDCSPGGRRRINPSEPANRIQKAGSDRTRSRRRKLVDS